MLGALAISSLGCAGPSVTEGCCNNFSRHQIFEYLLPVGLNGDIATLDPDLATDPASRTVVSLLYDGLVTLDQHLQVEWWGARQIVVSPDGLTYTIHLQPNQKFADGTPVTAADNAYSINRALNPCLASPLAPDLFAIRDAETFANETCGEGQISVDTAIGQTGPVNNVVTCPLFQGQQFYQVRQCVHGWSLGPDGLVALDTWINTYLDNTCPNA